MRPLSALALVDLGQDAVDAMFVACGAGDTG